MVAHTQPRMLDLLTPRAIPAVRTDIPDGAAHVGRSSREVEWYTPGVYIEAARAALGGIDLDPASCATANAVVKATSYYTAEDDGLAKPWAGRVWLNPPYANGLVGEFVDRLVDAYRYGHVTAACALVNNATETRWFHTLVEAADAVCLIRGRVRYWHPERESHSPLQGQAVIYLGDTVARFAQAFHPLGYVAVPVKAGAS